MKIRINLVALVGALSVAVLVASQASATPVLDFGVVTLNTGTMNYAGGANPLVGSGIGVQNVTGQLGTPLNDGVTRTCINCALNFTTGNFVSAGSGIATFAGGGSITITGGVDLSAVPDNDASDPEDIATTTLLSGTFDSVTLTLIGTTAKVFIPLFGDTKNQKLLDFWGLPSGPYSGFANISFMNTSGTNPPAAFNSVNLSGDIVNMPVNLPSSFLLIGSGLIGFIYLHVRQRRS
jgi:hypothetical protein